MEATLSHTNQTDSPSPERIAVHFLEALAELSRTSRARIMKGHCPIMSEADLDSLETGITWLDQQHQRESQLILGRALISESPNLIGGHSCKVDTQCAVPDSQRPLELQLESRFEGLLMDELPSISRGKRSMRF